MSAMADACKISTNSECWLAFATSIAVSPSTSFAKGLALEGVA